MREPGHMPAMPPGSATGDSTSWHTLDVEAVLDALGSSRQGLEPGEASARLARLGPNRLPEPSPPGPLARLAEQLNDPLIYLLLATAGVTAALGEWVDTGVIAAVVVINAVVGFVQQSRAEQAIASLRGMLAPTARVVRGGEEVSVGLAELVVGDVVLLASGDKVPADARLMSAHTLRCDEAALTGESVPQTKQLEPAPEGAPLGERHCLVFAGTLVTAGTARAVVTRTGSDTELGRIAGMLRGVRGVQTPLARRLARFGHVVMIAIGLFCALVFGAGMLTGRPWIEMLMAVVALAVSAIPEGLPAIVTITLAVGVKRMATHRAVVRRLPSVEALGGVTVICSDKTGTLTRNEMTVEVVWTPGGRYLARGEGYEPWGSLRAEHGEQSSPLDDPAVAALVQAAALCNDARLRTAEDGTVRLVGDPTEGALLALAGRAGCPPEDLVREWPRLDELPFDSARGFMVTVHRGPGGQVLACLKGSPERVLESCEQLPSGATLPQDAWRERAERLAAEGQRVLAFAQATVPEGTPVASLADDRRWTFLGLTGMTDPPRSEAMVAVQRCHAAGIVVKMITGDHLTTARAIARRMGIPDEGALSGPEVDALDAAALDEALERVHVFARVSPAHKLRFVEGLQRLGHIVSMTGDGVNDAPALKQADIGVAMGITGTEVSREAADMVLLDDNFASIEHAVLEGRTVFDNVKKTILFILPTNGGECLTLVAALLAGVVLPILPLHILWINLVTTVALAIALAFDPPEPETMQRPPRSPREPLLDRPLLFRIVSVSLWMAAGVFGLFHLELASGATLPQARGTAVNAMVVFEIFYLFNTRRMSEPSLRPSTFTGNPVVLWGVAATLLAQAAFTYWPPLAGVFGVAPLGPASLLRVVGAGALLLLLVEGEKALARVLRRRAGPAHP